jgi:hypothetical protein
MCPEDAWCSNSFEQKCAHKSYKIQVAMSKPRIGKISPDTCLHVKLITSKHYNNSRIKKLPRNQYKNTTPKSGFS